MPISSSNPVEPPPGLGRDIQRAREGTFATAAELREFVHSLKGKSPQEVLGAVANSGLTQGVLMSTLITIVVMAFFTVGPYFWSEKPQPKPAAKPVAVAQPAPAATSPAVTAPGPAAAPSAAATANAQQTLEKLGETETKTADPKVNPLDNLDDLLDTKN